MRIGLTANPKIPGTPELCARIVKSVGKDHEVVLEKEIAAPLGAKGVGFEGERFDVVLAVGGDGTILRAFQLADGDLLGINSGSLGFLTETTANEFPAALRRLETKRFAIEGRAKVSVRVWASFPFGKVTSVRSSVRTREERMPMLSTVPTTFSIWTRSPTRNGWSTPIATEPNRFSTVFWAASASATPPMPRPASRLATWNPSSFSTATSPSTSRITFESFRPSGRRPARPAFTLVHGAVPAASNATSSDRKPAQKKTKYVAARSPWPSTSVRPPSRSSHGSRAVNTAIAQSPTSGRATRARRTSSHCVPVRFARWPSTRRVTHPSTAPTTRASATRTGTASHCHQRSPRGPSPRSGAGRWRSKNGRAPASSWPSAAVAGDVMARERIAQRRCPAG